MVDSFPRTFINLEREERLSGPRYYAHRMYGSKGMCVIIVSRCCMFNIFVGLLRRRLDGRSTNNW